MAEEIEVLVVDDSPFVRRAVQRMLDPCDGVRVVGTAADGREAVELATRLRPDVVILDIVMPEMNGLDAIRGIMKEAPTAILVLSSHVRPGAETTLSALDLGAVDFISKTDAGTRMDIYDLAPVLREKVRAVAGSRLPTGIEEPRVAEQGVEPAPVATSAYDVLAIGASTGGPRALARILPELPPNFPGGVVIAQHMPPGFTATLAERLNRRSRLTVREARDGDLVEPGTALVGVGGRHLEVEGGPDGLRVRLPRGGHDLLHRPSVDLLFRSVAAAAGSRAVGLVLTGMGHDGALGLAAIRAAGGRTLVESEATAVIYGMPRAALPAAERELPLDRIAAAVRALFEAGAE